MRLSAIEIGTNSTKFIIAEKIEGKKINVIERQSVVNRLSDNMYKSNTISADAIEKGIEIIGGFIDTNIKMDSKLISIFSTSVLRDAVNKNDFVSRVKQLYGIDIDIISGEKEAHLAFKACRRLARNDEMFAVIDIGGGSTEITVGYNDSQNNASSINIGTVRLKEMFIGHDPAEKDEISLMSDYIKKMVKKSGLSILNQIQLIGTGGTIKSIGTILSNEHYSNEMTVDGLNFSREDIMSLYTQLVRLTAADKTDIKGLSPKRADVIAVGILILLVIMKEYEINSITVSSQGVLEGFIWEYFNSQII